MTSLLLIISFLLHILTLTGLYALVKQIQVRNNDRNESKEIIELLETYLEEIKEENNRLQKEVSLTNTSKTNSNTHQLTPNMNEEVMQKTNTIESENSLDEYSQGKMETMGDEVQASLQARILQLHEKGMNEEEIARQLNCGKTEVALTIKFYGKK